MELLLPALHDVHRLWRLFHGAHHLPHLLYDGHRVDVTTSSYECMTRQSAQQAMLNQCYQSQSLAQIP